MRNLEKIFGEERWKEISKLAINPMEVTIYNSIMFKKYGSNDPIYLTHTNLPTLIDSEGDVIDSKYVTDEDYIIGDYFWDTIDYTNIVFTDLIQVDRLGDVILITANEVFELADVSIDFDENRLFYDEAVLVNE